MLDCGIVDGCSILKTKYTQGGEGRMNREFVNAQVSRLPIAMAGIVHGYAQDGRGLSTFNHTITQLAKRLLP